MYNNNTVYENERIDYETPFAVTHAFLIRTHHTHAPQDYTNSTICVYIMINVKQAFIWIEKKLDDIFSFAIQNSLIR